MFESFFAKFARVIPRVKADDEEIEDPQQILRRKKPLHEVRTQEKPKPLDNPIENSNPKSTPVNNKKETPENPTMNAADSAVNVECLTKKKDDDEKGKGKDNGKGGENGNGNGDNELPDPIDKLREKCREHRHAIVLAKKYEDCNSRVLSKSQTSETCVEELFDLLHVIDHCVTEKLFSKLK